MITATDRVLWPVGLRVSREDANERGTIVKNDPEIEVKWDDGKTSHYGDADELKVQLAQVEPQPPKVAPPKAASVAKKAR